MALKVWKEVPTNTTYTTASNWVGGVAPVSGDEVLFSQGSGNVDGSDETARLLAGFTVGSGYTGTMGSSGSPLKIDTPTFVFNGQGDHAWISLEDAGGSTVDCRILGTKSTALADYPTKGLHINANGAENLTPFVVGGGYVEQEASVGAGGIAGVEVSGGTVFLITLAVGGTLAISGGTCSSNAGTTGALKVSGGTWTQTAGSITTVEVYSGGTLDWQGAGNITNGTIRGSGVLTFANLEIACTVTTIKLYDSATLNISNGIKQPTFSNAVQQIGNGTTIITDATTTATISYI